MGFQPPEAFNIAGWFLDDRVREGRGDRVALRTDAGTLTYRQVQELSNRFARVLADAGVQPEQRVIVALPDVPEFVGALFGILKSGGVVVMVNPELRPDAVRYFYDYTRAVAAFVDAGHEGAFREAAAGARHLRELLVVGSAALDAALASASPEHEGFPSHRDDAAIWLFSGGTTGRPKAVIQTHTSFANSTELYGKGVLGLSEDDVTMSVPKLYFGYATGSNLLFPFSVGASAVLFPERCTADALFRQIARHRPTVLINVPTMLGHMVGHPDARRQDLSSLRLATSAGEALPEELHARWEATFGVELLDGLGTAEMWHVFLSNRPGDVRPGTLGKPVPGFDVRLRDEEGRDVPDGEVGMLWVKGNSRAVAYWQQMEKTRSAFVGEWYVSGDVLRKDGDGYFVYCGRSDDMLKVGGKWLAPGELENCLLQHPAVREVAVVGVRREDGLVKPHAFVVLEEDAAAAGAGADGPGAEALAAELQDFAKSRLEPYKYPRRVVFLDELPRTHLGKVDRGRLSGR